MRCDYCRDKLGLVVHRYWSMRFCSAACAQAYQQRLQGETRAKIRLLECATVERPPPGVRLPAEAGRHFAG